MFSKVKPCSFCGGTNHTSLKCFKKQQKPMRPESVKSVKKRRITYKKWVKLNPPDENGFWYCYLQISSMCPKRLTHDLLTLEHVMPKVKAPELKYDPANIRPSCSFCNKLKGSRTLEQLAKTFPHIKIMLDMQSLDVVQ